MDDLKIKNKQGLELTIATNYPDNCSYCPIMGGDDGNPTWAEYLKGFQKKYRPHIELVKKGIKKMGWVGCTGQEIANEYCFIFNDNNAIGFSWRAWGDLMQAIVNKKEGYMIYYM